MLSGLTAIPSDPLLSVAAESKTLVSGAYVQMRRDIIEGRLKPGFKLKVEHLKEDYNVGAGTLREAMALLSADALVTLQGQRGFRVAPISKDDFRDITETRVDLECRAMRLSIERGNDVWEASLSSSFHLLTLAEQRLQEGDPETFNAWEVANKRFHAILISESNSRWTQHFLGILYSQAERYRRLLLVNRPASRNVHDEHKAIFEAAILREPDQATALLTKHIRINYDLLRDVLSD